MARYADGPTTEAEITIAAPLARVWELVTDINLPAQFSSEFQGARWTEGDGPALAARFVGSNQHPAIGAWESPCVVNVFDLHRAFGWAVGDPGHPGAQWRFELEQVGEAVLLRQRAQIGPGPSGLSPAIEAMPDKEERIIERRLAEHQANMRRTLEGIKRLAERREQPEHSEAPHHTR
jgi:hypothetical protein